MVKNPNHKGETPDVKKEISRVETSRVETSKVETSTEETETETSRVETPRAETSMEEISTKETLHQVPMVSEVMSFPPRLIVIAESCKRDNQVQPLKPQSLLRFKTSRSTNKFLTRQTSPMPVQK